MNDDLGKLIVRLTVGGLMLPHGVAKIFSGLGGVQGMLAGQGLPAYLSYGVYVGEVLAPLLVLVGLYSRLGGLLIAANMVVAIYLAHASQIFSVAKSGGWAIELQMFFLLTGVAVAVLGAGRYSVGGRAGKFN